MPRDTDAANGEQPAERQVQLRSQTQRRVIRDRLPAGVIAAGVVVDDSPNVEHVAVPALERAFGHLDGQTFVAQNVREPDRIAAPAGHQVTFCIGSGAPNA